MRCCTFSLTCWRFQIPLKARFVRRACNGSFAGILWSCCTGRVFPGINQMILQYFYCLQPIYWQMKYSINLMLAVQKSNGKVQKIIKAKAFLSWKHPCWSVTKKDKLKAAEEPKGQVISGFPSHLPMYPWRTEALHHPFLSVRGD